MGRKFVIVSFILVFGCGMAMGQGGGRRSSRPRADFGRGNHDMHPVSPQRNFQQLSPEERQTFRRNAERWLQMNPQQRQALRELEQARREHLKRDAETVMRQSGLRLDPKAREEFESRYFQERRRMERAIREEIESKKQQELPQLNERLKNEFQRHEGSSSPAVSVTPGR